MTGQWIAWLILLAACLGGAWSLNKTLQNFSNLLIKKLIICGMCAFFLTPAPVPGYPGAWAPAFVVALFEALFQIDGTPGSAALSLLAGVGVTLVLVRSVHAVQLRARTRGGVR